MFENATDESNFTVSSTNKDLGSKVGFPTIFENKRKEIVEKLKPYQ
jgi:hypothetical protein